MNLWVPSVIYPSGKCSDSGRLTFFERNSSFAKRTLCNYWKSIPPFVPLNSLRTDIFVLQIGAVQAECIYIFVQWKFLGEKN